jgi:SAM-dependent methyltransferase
MNRVFDAYARYYDLLYRDKDYAGEASYVASHIREYSRIPGGKRILELGCGTGAHAEQLARLGHTVHGVDRSETMLARAIARRSGLPGEIGDRLTFEPGDARSVRVNGHFDAVIALFHVMSYQTANADLEAVVETAAAHLSPGGLFLFDFWYGPAVLAQKPDARVKHLEDDDIKVTRTAEPVMQEKLNVVDVHYAVQIELKGSGKVEQLQETHSMRYLFLPDVSRLLDPRVWGGVKTFGWLGHEEPDQGNWSACAMAVRG